MQLFVFQHRLLRAFQAFVLMASFSCLLPPPFLPLPCVLLPFCQGFFRVSVSKNDHRRALIEADLLDVISANGTAPPI